MTSEAKLAYLLNTSAIFIIQGKETIELWANANDCFGWATADCEPLKWTDEEPEPDIDALYDAVMSKDPWAYVKWLCAHRGQPPMPEIIYDMNKMGDWPFPPFDVDGKLLPDPAGSV